MDYDLPADEGKLVRGLRTVPALGKLCGAFVFSLSVALLSRPLPALGACVFAVLLLVCSGLSPALIARRLIPVALFFLPLWLLLPLSFNQARDSATIAGFGALSLNMSGVALALLITLKGNAIAAALLALTGSSGVSENGHALIRLGAPKKLVALLLVTHSNLGRMAEEYQRGFQAAKLRAFAPASNLASYGTYASLIGLLLARSWRRAQRVETAMRLRSFCGRFPLIAPRKQANEACAVAVFLLCCLASAALLLWNRHV
jgi:cobalt/nickel transport system permease protein